MVQNFDIRGFGQTPFTSRVLLLIDGIPYNSWDKGGFPQHPGFDFFMLQNVKRLEIVRGPGSALYGENAFWGVINIVTLSGEDLQGGRVELYGGDLENQAICALYGSKLSDDVSLFVSARAHARPAADGVLVRRGRQRGRRHRLLRQDQAQALGALVLPPRGLGRRLRRKRRPRHLHQRRRDRPDGQHPFGQVEPRGAAGRGARHQPLLRQPLRLALRGLPLAAARSARSSKASPTTAASCSAT